MDFPVHIVPPALLWVANAGLLLVFLLALSRAPLARLWNNEFSHVFFAACVVMLLLWNTRVGVLPALNFHLLGLTAVTLMFGWAFAVLAVIIVTAGSIIVQGGDWTGLGLNALVMGCLPVAVTHWLLQLVQRHLPHNFFIYVYLNGFFAAGLSLLAAASCGALLMLLADSAHGAWLAYQFWPFLPLVFFSEAIVNGIIMTMMVALRPGWVASFDDESYINNK